MHSQEAINILITISAIVLCISVFFPPYLTTPTYLPSGSVLLAGIHNKKEEADCFGSQDFGEKGEASPVKKVRDHFFFFVLSGPMRLSQPETLELRFCWKIEVFIYFSGFVESREDQGEMVDFQQ